MKAINRKKLVLSLIKDDLINSKLVWSLNDVGLSAEGYHLYISTTIMNLMRIRTTPLRWEEIHDGYLLLTKKVKGIDIQDSPELLNALAMEIYRYVRDERRKLKLLKSHSSTQ